MSYKRQFEERVGGLGRDKSLSKFIFALTFMFLLVASATMTMALPGIELDTELNKQDYYTLPLLGTETLEHVVNTTRNDSALDTQVSVDLVRGIATGVWWDEDYMYKRPMKIEIPASATTNDSLMLDINLAQAISNNKIRDDFKDLRLVEGEDMIEHYLVDSNNNDTVKAVFRLDNLSNRTRTIDLYYGNEDQDTLPVNDSVFMFVEDFDDISEWNITNGSFTLNSGVLESDLNTTSRIMLDDVESDGYNYSEIDVPVKIGYSLALEQNSTSSLLLAKHKNLTDIQLNITLEADTDKVTICSGGACEIKDYDHTIGEFSQIAVDLREGRYYVEIDGTRIFSSTHDIDSFYLAFENFNITHIDDLKLQNIVEMGVDNYGPEQELLQKQTTSTVDGIFGWNYDITGMETDEYSIYTDVSKTNYLSNSTLDIFNMHYKKIGVDIHEEGKVTLVKDKYVTEAKGEITFTNPNNKNISIDVLYNTPLSVYGENFTENGIVYPEMANLSELSLSYYITGVSEQDPIQGVSSILGTAILRADGLGELYEFTQNSLTRTDKVIHSDEPESDTGSITKIKTEQQFTLESLADTYLGMPVRVEKSLSKETVDPGEVVDVEVKVRNVDVVSKQIRLEDSIPEGFIHVEGVNQKTEEKDLRWNFDLNKESTKIFRYKMMYVGESIGEKQLEPAIAYFGTFNSTSNRPLIFRDQGKETKVYVQKRIATGDDKSVDVTIDVINVGDKTIDELHLMEMLNGHDISQETIRTPFDGEWIIRDFNPGERWNLRYQVDDHELIENVPQLISYEQDVDVVSELIKTSKTKEFAIWKEERTSFISMLIFLTLVLELAGMLFYFRKNPPEIYLEMEEQGFVKVAMRTIDDILNKLLGVPSQVIQTFKNLISLISYYSKVLKVYYRMSRIWVGKKIPLIWKLFDKLKVLNKYEWFLFLKMFVDYLMKYVKKIYTLMLKLLRPLSEDFVRRIKDPKALGKNNPSENMPKEEQDNTDTASEKDNQKPPENFEKSQQQTHVQDDNTLSPQQKSKHEEITDQTYHENKEIIDKLLKETKK